MAQNKRKLGMADKFRRYILYISGVALLIASSANIYLNYISYKDALFDRLSTLASFITLNSTDALMAGDVATVDKLLSSLESEKAIRGAFIYTADWQKFASYSVDEEVEEESEEWIKETTLTDEASLSTRKMKWI